MTSPAETINRIAAVVNDEVITTFQLEQALKENPAAGAEGKRQVLEKMIENTLLQQRIREIDLRVTDEELEAAIVDVQRQNNLTRGQLEDALRQQGMSLAEYRENLRGQILQFKLLAREVESQIEVSNQEIRDYFQEHVDDYRQPPSIRLSRISFPLPAQAGEEQVAAVRRQADAAREQLLQGEDFSSVLRSASAAVEADGGDMGLVKHKDLTGAFANAVRDLGPGQVSAIIETPQGLHLLLVTDRNTDQVRQLDEVKEEIANILREQKGDGGLQRWKRQLKEKARIEIRI
jgi:peptidyl-prolyl cis-trans isomerase SurA